MKRTHVVWLALLGAVTAGCPDDAPVQMDATGSEGSSTGDDDATAGIADGSSTGGGVAPDGTTTGETTGAIDDTTGAQPGTTGGCMPGVFGDSVFGAACFQ